MAVRGAWVLDAAGSQVTLGRDDCPPGMFCGAALAILMADFSSVQPTPEVDSLIDVYGTVASDFSLLVHGYN